MSRSISVGRREILPGQVINRMDAHGYEITIQDLLEKIDLLEGKIRYQDYEKSNIEQKNEAMGGMNKNLTKNLIETTKTAQKLQREKDNCDKKINELKNFNKLIVDTNKEKEDFLRNELEKNKKTINKLNNDLKNKKEELKKTNLLNDLTQNYYNTHRNELDKQKEINKNNLKKISDLEKLINNMNILKKHQDVLMVENNHLKEDNLKLLKKINELQKDKNGYSFLGQTYLGGVRFVTPEGDNNTKRGYNQRAKSVRNKCRGCQKNICPDEEKQNWIPIEAFNVANDYIIKCNLDISDEDLENLLYQLNKIWQSKFRKEINHVKTVYQNEIKDLRAKLNTRTSYNQFMDEKMIKDLKKSLRDTRDLLRDNIVTKYKMFECPVQGIIRPDFSKTTTNFRKSAKKEEVVQFKNNDIEYNYGVLNLSEKVYNEIKMLENNIMELFDMYKEKINIPKINNLRNINFYKEIIDNSVSWFFDAVIEAISNYKNKINEYKLDAQRNVKM